MAHIEGTSRHQRSLVSASLDEQVPGGGPVRVIDAFVAGLALGSLGFGKVAAATGRPPFRPADLLKLYVYGYLNQVRSGATCWRSTGRRSRRWRAASRC